jgi:hypothetical protein
MSQARCLLTTMLQQNLPGGLTPAQRTTSNARYQVFLAYREA